MKRFYTGIGSRNTPKRFNYLIQQIGQFLEEEGYILRSGGARGSDTLFEESVKDDLNKEIYLPWKNFNNNKSELYLENLKNNVSAFNSVIKFHPRGKQLGYLSGPFKLMARNYYQVFGDFNNPNNKSDFIICYTLNGIPIGGTSQALRIAAKFEIPVFNLGLEYSFNDFKQFYHDCNK